MKKAFLYITLILSIISCSEPEEKNNYIIDNDKLIDILYHFHIIDASAKQGIIDNNRNNLIRHKQYAGILEKYDVTRAEFDSTITFYVKKPDQMKLIYEKVETRIINKFDSYDPPKSFKNNEDE